MAVAVVFAWQATSYLLGRRGPMTVGLPFLDPAVLLVIGACLWSRRSAPPGTD